MAQLAHETSAAPVVLPLRFGGGRFLSQLYRDHRILQLSRALSDGGKGDPVTAYYRSVCDARVGRESTAIEGIRKFVATKPAPEAERRAIEELAATLVRACQYADAASAYTEVLRLAPSDDPDRSETENSRALVAALSDVRPQTAEFGPDLTVKATLNALGSWNVPVQINGQSGSWIIDTGANFSTLSTSEAARLGLPVRDTKTYAKGSTGKRNSLRVAVAPSLQIGRVALHNVVFLAVEDKAIYIAPLRTQISGILGLPALRALKQLAISADGDVHIGQKAAGGVEGPNLFFDEFELVVGIRHRGRDLQLFLDTGANSSELYASALTEEELAGLKKRLSTAAGAGGAAKRHVAVVPAFEFELLGAKGSLAKVTLALEPPAGEARRRDGVLGSDALTRGFELDFENMQLRLD